MSTVQEFDFSVDLLQALLWKHNRAARLQALLQKKQDWYNLNQAAFWDDWYTDVFNLQTANDFGLSVWGRILAVPLVAGIPGSGDRPVFGFGDFNQNFNHGTFGRDSSGSISLTTEQKRLVLRLRYFQLISNGTPFQINEFLKVIFGDLGSVYVLDGLDMSQTYVFTFAPASQVLLVLESFDLLPRPEGVGSRILVNPGDSFGFAPYYLAFNQATFGA